MQICALAKTTLLDYPQHVAATIFLGGCNFKCPFCHNRDIVFSDNSIKNGTLTLYSKEDILAFLKKRRNILTGVCVTGGEPTLNQDLPELLHEVRHLGYKIKLDTNGSNPDMLRLITDNGLIDYCAMDIKNSPQKYGVTVGLPDISADSELLMRIRKSADILMSHTDSNFSYEFRTTIVKELHAENDICVISQWIAGARAYFLQSYEESEGVICKGYHAHDEDTLKHFAKICQINIPNTQLRGVEI